MKLAPCHGYRCIRALSRLDTAARMCWQANAVQPVRLDPKGAVSEATWLQQQLSNFVRLRTEAVKAQAQLQCMPVIITASTRASASTLQNTASGNSKVKDLQLWPLTEQESASVVLDLVQRFGKQDACSAGLPEKVLVLLRLLGGNPRLLVWALVALCGKASLRGEMYTAGTSVESHNLYGDK